MCTTLAVNPRDIPEVLRRAFPHYNGRLFNVVASTEVTLSGNYWEGGSKKEYRGVDLLSGRVLDPSCAEFGNPFTHPGVPTIKLSYGQVIACHSIVCGKDRVITYYVHPDNITKLIPQSGDTLLSDTEKIVLYYTRSRKSSYAGISDYRYHEANRVHKISREEWDRGKASLQARGYLDKRNALTIAGKNAARQLPINSPF